MLAAEIDAPRLKPVHRVHKQHTAVTAIQVPIRAGAVAGGANLRECGLVHRPRRHVPEEGDVVRELDGCFSLKESENRARQNVLSGRGNGSQWMGRRCDQHTSKETLIPRYELIRRYRCHGHDAVMDITAGKFLAELDFGVVVYPTLVRAVFGAVHHIAAIGGMTTDDLFGWSIGRHYQSS